MALEQVFANETSLWLLFGVSFLGGLISSISPCSLSMLPIIVGYIGGYSDESPIKTFWQMLFFIFGTAIVFSIIGVVCAATGKVFVSSPYFALIISSIIMIMGLKLAGILDFEFPVLIKQMPKKEGFNVYVYPVVLGIVFALIGTPCSTPVLAGIMGFASLSANIAASVIMLFLFALGQGFIFIFAGVLTSKFKNMNGFYKFSDLLLKFCGWLLVLASIYIFYKIFSPLIVN